MMRIQRSITVVALFGLLGTYASRLNAQAAATVCKDGTTSAASGRGACSGHGGVDTKATAAAKKTAKAEAKAEKKAASKSEAKTERAEKSVAQVTCSDGTMSKPGRGACSGHGGVRTSANATAAPTLPAPVPASSPARTRSEAKSKAPSTTNPSANRAEDSDPTGAIAQCKDGLYSHAANRRGACSRHGGVSKWLKEP